MTIWRGVNLDQRTAEMMEEVARLAGDVYVRPTQGSYSGGVQASAGTHDGGGAIDIAGQDSGMTQADRDVIERSGRMVGFAMWIRTPDQSDWPWHLHGIAVQSGKNDRGVLSSGAHGQVIDYYEGRNGLASGAADDGPREWVGTTWESYKAAAGQPPPPPKDEDDMAKARIFTLLGNDSNSGEDDALGLFTPDGRFVPLHNGNEVTLAERYVQFCNNPEDGALYGFEAKQINSLLDRAV